VSCPILCTFFATTKAGHFKRKLLAQPAITAFLCSSVLCFSFGFYDFSFWTQFLDTGLWSTFWRTFGPILLVLTLILFFFYLALSARLNTGHFLDPNPTRPAVNIPRHDATRIYSDLMLHSQTQTRQTSDQTFHQPSPCWHINSTWFNRRPSVHELMLYFKTKFGKFGLTRPDLQILRKILPVTRPGPRMDPTRVQLWLSAAFGADSCTSVHTKAAFDCTNLVLQLKKIHLKLHILCIELKINKKHCQKVLKLTCPNY